MAPTGGASYNPPNESGTPSEHRLDDRGELLQDCTPKGASLKMAWVSKTDSLREEDGKQIKCYGKVKVGEHVLEPPCYAYLTPEDDEELVEICYVLYLFVGKGNAKMMKVQWLWRPEQIEMPTDRTYGKREIYISDDTDPAPVGAFEGLCSVKNAVGEVVDESSLAPHQFYYKSKIDTDAMEIEDLLPDAEPMATDDAAAPPRGPAAGAPPPPPPPAAKGAAKKARGGATVKTLELRIASLEAENKIMQEQMKELMVAHRTREAACEAEVGAAPEP